MKTPCKLDLNTIEKEQLRKNKIAIVQLQNYTVDEIEALLQTSAERAQTIAALIGFQRVPSLGFNFASELIDQGYTSLAQLKGKDPVELFNAYERHCGAWADPCVEDSYRLLAHYIAHNDKSKNWWDFTAERKAYRAKFGFPADRPKKAWHELPKYQKVK